jgi:nucleoid DNA-binding protein
MPGTKLTKSQFIATVAEKSGLSKKQASVVLDSVNAVVVKQLKNSGEVTIPGLLKLKIKKKPPRPAGERLDPFTKQMRMFPAKPASKSVRATAVKALKDAVA